MSTLQHTPQERIRFQLAWNRLLSVVEEQAQVLIRSAFGTATREAGDLSAGVFLPDGRMIAQAVTGTPGHVNAMAESVKHFLKVFPPETLKDGDVLLTNDPWKGTGHLFDMTMVSPVFHDGALVALFASTLHVIDIGGIGSSADGLEVYHEGLFLPILRFFHQHQVDPGVLAIIRANVREPLNEPRAYLRTIATRLLIGRARRAALETADAESLALQPAAVEPSVEARALILEALEQVCELLDSLSMTSRRIFLMAQVDGMSYADIGQQLGMTPNAVQKSLARALVHCYAAVYE